MKRIICIALAALLSTSLLASCGDKKAEVSSTVSSFVESQEQSVVSTDVTSETTVVEESSQTPTTTTTAKTTQKTEKKSGKTATLYCVLGNETKTADVEWSGDFLDPKFLIEELSKYTGVNMNCADAFSGKGGITVDFDDSSPLFNGELYVSDNPRYHMYDYDSTAWFILDSIYTTLNKNNGGNVDIYFSYKGDSFKLKTSPEIEIDAFTPYKGSQSYLG